MHLRHRLVHPGEHRKDVAAQPGRSPINRGLAGARRQLDLRPGGCDLRHRRGDPMVAGRLADHRVSRRDGSHRQYRQGLCRSGVRAGTDRSGRASLGSDGARIDPRHHSRHHPSSPGEGDTGGNRLRGARRVRHHRDSDPGAACRWRCEREPATHADTGGSARCAGRTPQNRGHDRSGSGVPGRAGHRRVGQPGGDSRHLDAGTPLRARPRWA